MKTSVRLKFRPSSIQGKAGSLFFQILRCGTVKFVKTGFRIFPSEWDPITGCIASHAEQGQRENELKEIQSKIDKIAGELREIDSTLASSGKIYTAHDVMKAYEQAADRDSLYRYFDKWIGVLRQNNRRSAAKSYRVILNSIRDFRNNADTKLADITPEFLAEFESWLHDRGLTRNSTGAYMRILRALCNKAMDDNLVSYPPRLFRRVYTGVDKTKKRSLSRKQIVKIKNLDFGCIKTERGRQGLEWARDLFMFSFYTRGMSFIDMAKLQKSDVVDGRIEYMRSKTKQKLVIGIEAEMQEIISRWDHLTGKVFLLPIITGDIFSFEQYQNELLKYNSRLARISAILNIVPKITTYVARHSWATMAKRGGIPVSIISESLGHDSEKTTEIYLAGFEQPVIDRANRLVMNAISQPDKVAKKKSK